MIRWIAVAVRGGVWARLIRDVAAVSSSHVVASAIGLACLIVTARALPPDDLGALLYAQSFAFLVGRVFGLLGWQAFTRYGAAAIARSEINSGEDLLAKCILIDVIGSLVAVTVCLLLSMAAVAITLSPSSLEILAISSVAILGKCSASISSYLRAREKVSFLVFPNIFLTTLKLSVLVVLSAYTRELWVYVIVWTGHSLAVQIWPFIPGWAEMRRQKFRPHFNGQGAHMRKLLSFSLRTHLSTVSQSAKELDTVIVGSLGGASSVAIFRLAKDLPLKSLRIVDVLAQLAFPLAVKLRAVEGVGSGMRFALQVMIAAAAAGLLFAVFLVGAVSIAFPAFLAEAYRPAIVVSVVFALALPLEAAYRATVPQLFAGGSTKIVAQIGAASATLYLAIVALASLYGTVVMAAAAYALASAVGVAGLAYAILKRDGPGRNGGER